MKKYIFLSIIALLPFSLFAQNCGGYYYLANHAEIQMTTYGSDGTPRVIVTSHISKVSAIPGGKESHFESTVKDENGKVMEKGSGTAQCKNGILSVDMRQSMPSMKQFQDMQVKADAAYIEYPANMHVGQSLPDASCHMEMDKKESGKRFATVDYTISNRKVAAKEKITTPAGAWDCFKITSDMKMRMKIGIGIPFRFKVTEWFAPDFGIVKTADFNKKGKKIGYTVLTRFRK